MGQTCSSESSCGIVRFGPSRRRRRNKTKPGQIDPNTDPIMLDVMKRSIEATERLRNPEIVMNTAATVSPASSGSTTNVKRRPASGIDDGPATSVLPLSMDGQHHLLYKHSSKQRDQQQPKRNNSSHQLSPSNNNSNNNNKDSTTATSMLLNHHQIVISTSESTNSRSETKPPRSTTATTTTTTMTKTSLPTTATDGTGTSQTCLQQSQHDQQIPPVDNNKIDNIDNSSSNNDTFLTVAGQRLKRYDQGESISSSSSVPCPTRLLIRRKPIRCSNSIYEEGASGTHIYAIRYPDIDGLRRIVSGQDPDSDNVEESGTPTVPQQEQCPSRTNNAPSSSLTASTPITATTTTTTSKNATNGIKSILQSSTLVSSSSSTSSPRTIHQDVSFDVRVGGTTSVVDIDNPTTSALTVVSPNTTTQTIPNSTNVDVRQKQQQHNQQQQQVSSSSTQSSSAISSPLKQEPQQTSPTTTTATSATTMTMPPLPSSSSSSLGVDVFSPAAMAAPPKCDVVEWVTISEERNIYIVDVGLSAEQCDYLVNATEQACKGQYAAYTYAKQTLGCREYPFLAQVSFLPVHTVVHAIKKKFDKGRQEKGRRHQNGATDETGNGATSETTDTKDGIGSTQSSDIGSGDNNNNNRTTTVDTSTVDKNDRAGLSSSTANTKTTHTRKLQLDDREPHVVKYDVTKKERQKLDMHTDKSEWTFLIALSNGCGVDYEGGGTYFECIDATVHIQRGHALVFPGKLRHCGQKITSGLRFLLVGFLVDKTQPPTGSGGNGNGDNNSNNNSISSNGSSATSTSASHSGAVTTTTTSHPSTNVVPTIPSSTSC